MSAENTTRVTRYRDEIHGDVILDPIAISLLSTNALQRLGRVYQLGYTHLVYRGATHTRLSHVIGAYHMAGRFVDGLRDNYRLTSRLPMGAVQPTLFLPNGDANAQSPIEARWLVFRCLVQWAALLHDIGHVPLGHTLEDEFEGIYISHDDFRSPRLRELWWEKGDGRRAEVREVFESASTECCFPPEFREVGISPRIAYAVVRTICLYKEKREVGGTKYKSFQELLTEALTDTELPLEAPQRIFIQAVQTQLDELKNCFAPYMVDIVSNTICADYMDYVRRDTANAGLDRQTDDRVLSQFFVGTWLTPSKSNQYRMALLLTDSRGKPRLDTCTGVVDLVRRRFRLAEIIYYHKTKVSASAMLAKALSLVGKPKEIPTGGPDTLAIGSEGQWAEKLRSGEMRASDLCEQYSPNSLLSPEIGDESLLVWLQHGAWKRVEDLVGHQNSQPTKDAASENEPRSQLSGADEITIEGVLRGIGLLQLIGRRKLYKVFAQINADAVAHITGIDGVDRQPTFEQISQSVDTVLRLRDKKDGETEPRAQIERRMSEAAGWPEDSLIIYVPPRKSQAKGIETRAFSGGSLVTLGEHPAISGQVSELSRQYEGLWRVILLVHPDYQNDDIGLSRALDAFVKEVWNVDVTQNEEHLRRVARYDYIPEPERAGAELYSRLRAPSPANWHDFERAGSTVEPETTMTALEQAARAYLIGVGGFNLGIQDHIRNHFPRSGDIERHVYSVFPEFRSAFPGRSIPDSAIQRLRAIFASLEAAPPIASELGIESQTLGVKQFEDESRAIFRRYVPSLLKGRLNRPYLDFINRNRAQSGRRRYFLAKHLRKYDLSDVAGLEAQFNRQDGAFLEAKLQEIERLAQNDDIASDT